MEKVGSFVKFPHFLPDLCSLNSPEKCSFLQFCTDLRRNLSLLKQFSYMHLKVFITLVQKMIWFIGVWATFHEILAIKTSDADSAEI